MAKRFKFKRRRKLKLKKNSICYIFIFIIIGLFVLVLFKNKSYIKNKEIFNIISSGSFNNTIDLNKVLNLFNKDITKPETFLVFANSKNNFKINDEYSDEDDYIQSDYEKITSYIENTNKINISDPEVYIYNTHQLETYSSSGIDNEKISPNVMMASYLLSDKLNSMGVKTISEDTNIYEFIKRVGLDDGDFYESTRLFVKQAKEKYPSLKLIIDLHRDSVGNDISKININGVNYARVLFVLGTTNPNYEDNKNVMIKLDDYLNSNYPSISRGIYNRPTPTWPDSYNQDLGGNIILIELGGVENDIYDVMNTVDALSNAIKNYIKE